MLHAPPGTRPLLVTLPLKVQTYDIDFAHHVNNAVYIRWLEDLRMEVLRQYCPLRGLMADGVVPILASTNIVYKKSIELFDEPVGSMWCVQMGRATLTLHSEICIGEEVCATATQRGIMLYIGTTRPARIPKSLVQQYRDAIGG
ncbi:MAG: acyl-CoA thioesterase [Candidatus Hydrogenedentes bacterium]|nr:acyl-CoA thioesterase [Candidatus Hydrogenedentota bacterium]